MKHILLIIICSLLIFSCKELSKQVIQTNTKSPDSTKTAKKEFTDSSVLLYSDDQVRVYGNKILNDSSIYVERKFEPFITFSDFKVREIYNGKKSRINYNSHSIAREYRTIITDTYKNTQATFAGHYSFVEWGCGMPCQGSAIVDLIDGNVYEGVYAQSGFQYKLNSTMLIVNPPDSSGFYGSISFHGNPEIWIWNEKTKQFTRKGGE